jgi:hypothetical protein
MFGLRVRAELAACAGWRGRGLCEGEPAFAGHAVGGGSAGEVIGWRYAAEAAGFRVTGLLVYHSGEWQGSTAVRRGSLRIKLRRAGNRARWIESGKKR